MDEPKFTKRQILESEKYEAYRDTLSMALSDSETYTAEAVEEAIAKALSHEVVEEVNALGGMKWL